MDYLKALESLPSSFGGKKRGNSHFLIRCPYHKNGQERTPSLSINIDSNYRGFWKCFACGEKGRWSKLADKINLRHDGQMEGVYLPSINEWKEPEHFELRNSKPVNPQDCWRGIKGEVLKDIGAKWIYTEYGERLYLPIAMNGDWVSGIACTKEKEKVSYLYEKNPLNCWFPFDYVKRMANRYVVLVEGPRDALNLIQNGIPALANLGGVHSWRPSKAQYILDMELELIVLAFDPDEIGGKLTQKAHEFFAEVNQVCVKFTMDNNNGEKEDPGNLTPDRIEYLKSAISFVLDKKLPQLKQKYTIST